MSEQIRPAARLSLSASQKNQIMCASLQLKINCRDQFPRRVAKVLECCSQPPSHNDDAERAVRAGLELIATVTALKTHAPLQTRVGIATGLVVVGNLIGSGASQEQAIVGETPNLAARLQSIAEPNSVVIAESTRKLVGNLFEFQDLEAQDLKGMVGPVRAWAALRRTGHWQISVDGCTSRTRRQRATPLGLRQPLLSTTAAATVRVLLLDRQARSGHSREEPRSGSQQKPVCFRCRTMAAI